MSRVHTVVKKVSKGEYAVGSHFVGQVDNNGKPLIFTSTTLSTLKGIGTDPWKIRKEINKNVKQYSNLIGKPYNAVQVDGGKK